jgi:hypothetical protein
VALTGAVISSLAWSARVLSGEVSFDGLAASIIGEKFILALFFTESGDF